METVPTLTTRKGNREALGSRCHRNSAQALGDILALERVMQSRSDME